MVKGVYTDKQINSLINEGFIRSTDDSINLEDLIQPSSLDLTVGGKVYHLPYSSFHPKSENPEGYFDRIAYTKEDLSNGPTFLHRGNVYAVKLQQKLKLPRYISAKANPKSSTGRIDLHTRLVSRNSDSFDNVAKGYNGDLWVELFPRSFNIKLSEGDSLNQIRFFDPNLKYFQDEDLELLNRDNNGIVKIFDNVNSKSIKDDSLVLTASLCNDLVGYVGKNNAPVIDLSRRDLPASHYFEPISSNKGSIVLEPNSFYILNSSEKVFIPDQTCAEMIDIETGYGEFRGHYAGFFDPGFNAEAVLEIRNFAQPFKLISGQVVSGIRYYPMKEKTESLYGDEKNKSHYQGQSGPQLAKYFDMKK